MAGDFGVLRCPNCGAPGNPAKPRCDYCQAHLATVSCTKCFKQLFDGSAFCPYCGVARSEKRALDGKKVACPSCQGRMQWTRIGNIDLLECERCDGTWIESESFERLCTDREGQALMLQRAPSAAAPPGGPVKYRPCPRCRKLMNRINFGKLSGAVIDVCKGHGTFLDRGELHQIVKFILEGGMSRMRNAEIERLQEERRRLVDAERQQARLSARTGEASSLSQSRESWVEQLLMKMLE